MTKNIFKKNNRSTLGSHMVEDVEYPNLPSIAKEYGMSLNSVYKRYSRGYRGDDLVPKKRRKNYVPPKKEVKYKFYIKGKGYKSYQDACRKNNINYITFRKRRAWGWSLERALTTPILWYRGGSGISTSRAITVENKEFESVAEASRHYGLTPENVVKALQDGSTINQAFKLEIKPTVDSFEFEGKFYKNRKHLCEELNFPISVLQNRLHKGLTIRKSIDLGPKNLGNEGRYNREILERDPELAAKPANFYFVIVIINGNKRHKIGITTQKIKNRLSKEIYSYKILKLVKKPLLQCYLLEKQLLTEFSMYRDTNITSDQLDGYKEVFNFPFDVVENIKMIVDKAT